MNNLPKNSAEQWRRLTKTEPGTSALVSMNRQRRSDNVQLSNRVRGRVVTGAAKKAVRVTSEPDKTGMYEKPACGVLGTQRYLVRRRKKETATGSVLRVPKDASPEERANLRRWLAQADEISRRLNS